MSEVDELLAAAREELASADELRHLGRRRQAASRAYYGAYYAALALLKQAAGVQPKTHAGAVGQFGRLLMERPELGDRSLGRDLALLSDVRQDSDYGLAGPPSPNDLDELLATARRVVEGVEKALDGPSPAGPR